MILPNSPLAWCQLLDPFHFHLCLDSPTHLLSLLQHFLLKLSILFLFFFTLLWTTDDVFKLTFIFLVLTFFSLLWLLLFFFLFFSFFADLSTFVRLNIIFYFLFFLFFLDQQLYFFSTLLLFFSRFWLNFSLLFFFSW